MKQLLITLLILLSLSCKAQTIVPYDSNQSIYVPNSGHYYKDTNSLFNQFVGEWKWENSATGSNITILLKKSESLDSGENFTYDLLIGEYQYIENSIVKANTLLNINNPNIIGEYHKISGANILTKYNRPQCPECNETERRMQVGIEHDNYNGVYGKLIMRHVVENGIEKLHVIVKDGAWLSSNPDAPEDIDIPFGEYIMIKQN